MPIRPENKARYPAALRSLAVERDALKAERDKAQGYLLRCLQSLYPNIEPLPDLLGVCTQIDNVLAGQKAENARLRDAIEMARECIDDKDVIGARQTLTIALRETQ